LNLIIASIGEKHIKKTLEPEALLKEPSFKTPKDEYKIRVRVSLRALWALYDMRHPLTFFPIREKIKVKIQE
jgi:hypothetical protein